MAFSSGPRLPTSRAPEGRSNAQSGQSVFGCLARRNRRELRWGLGGADHGDFAGADYACSISGTSLNPRSCTQGFQPAADSERGRAIGLAGINADIGGTRQTSWAGFAEICRHLGPARSTSADISGRLDRHLQTSQAGLSDICRHLKLV